MSLNPQVKVKLNICLLCLKNEKIVFNYNNYNNINLPVYDLNINELI